MTLLSVLMIGIGLSMDAFAVAVAKGMCTRGGKTITTALYLAFFFGLFQAMMPTIGYFAGIYFSDLIASIDHWIAFFLLAGIGINMMREARGEEETVCEPLYLKQVIILAIATSIDALAVGISFAFLKLDSIWSAVAMIGITTFLLSFIAVFLGKWLGSYIEKYAQIFGGIVLIVIGLKILVEHLFLS